MGDRTFILAVGIGLLLLLGLAWSQLTGPSRMRRQAASAGWKSAELAVREMT